MLSLLLGLVGCGPGHDTTTYAACVTWTELACDCRNDEVDSADPEYFCKDDTVEVWCRAYDLDACDSASDKFDADQCQYVQDHDTKEALDYFNCANANYSDECNDDYAECGEQPEL